MYEEEVRVYKDIKKNQLLITEIENAIQGKLRLTDRAPEY